MFAKYKLESYVTFGFDKTRQQQTIMKGNALFDIMLNVLSCCMLLVFDSQRIVNIKGSSFYQLFKHLDLLNIINYEWS